MPVEQLPDVWAERDHPVLIATARLLDARGGPLTSDEIADAANVDHERVVRALTNLANGFLEVQDASSLGGRDCYALGITGRGLQAAGQWPTPEAAADRLLAALDQQIDNTVEGTPRSSRLRALRDGVASIGRDVLVDVMGGVLTGRIPT